jgi:hypothetical protein
VNAPKPAASMYKAFHRFEPRKVGEFERSFAIPSHAKKQGRSINVMYRSDKTDPETLKRPRKPVDYIHDHDPGVCTYLLEGAGARTEVPAWIREIDALVLLGGCLGFTFENPDGETIEGTGTGKLPELYTTTNGKTLLVIENKRTLVALMWGGKLRVEPRGIVG